MKKNTLFFLLLMSLALWTNCQKNKLAYPQTRQGTDKDTYFGETVPDPYQWLEQDTLAETKQWVDAQNKLTFGYLEAISYRKDILRRMEQVINFPRVSAPFKEGAYTYYYRNSGLQNQNVLYRKKEEQEEIFIDPNTFSADGTTRMGQVSFSKDGSLVAYELSKGGTDWSDIVVINAENKAMVEDTVRDIKFSNIAWRGNEGFYYSTYDKPQGSQISSQTHRQKLYYHKLGTPRGQEEIIFGGGQTVRRYVGGYLTEDERFLVISASNGTSGNELYMQDLSQKKSPIIAIVAKMDNEHEVIGNEGERLFIKTNKEAPNAKVVEMNFKKPEISSWKDIIPETENSLNAITTVGKKIFASYLVDVKTQVKQYDYNGKLEREIQLPGHGVAGGFMGKETDTETYYTFTSFTYPKTIFKYNLASGESTLYEKPVIDFNADDYVTEQVFYKSKDGARVPMYIVYKKTLIKDGSNPTLLYGYGGFNVNLTPDFSPLRAVWLESGGIYAQPNLRGGGEYGEKWHEAGTKMNKQNVFDDFIAAAEYLIEQKYTSSSRLAIQGASNGGLLVGAVMTQRPDLMAVALLGVGVLDMLRYHQFTVGAGWASDYGTADDSKEMFSYLKRYSPLHVVKPAAYPATLINTADHDDRVVPAHSFKFAAVLQANQQGKKPVLIRIDTKSGHGASNLSKHIQLAADQYAFTWHNMGVTPAIKK